MSKVILIYFSFTFNIIKNINYIIIDELVTETSICNDNVQETSNCIIHS